MTVERKLIAVLELELNAEGIVLSRQEDGFYINGLTVKVRDAVIPVKIKNAGIDDVVDLYPLGL